jgi:hypothetical protein
MKFALLAAAGLALAGAGAHAAPITYIITGVADVSVGEATYRDEAFSVVGRGDTSTVAQVTGLPFPNTIFVDTVSIDINLAGLPTAHVTSTPSNSLYFFDTQSEFGAPVDAAGFGAAPTPGDFLDISNAFFGAYDLQSAVSPLSVSSYFLPSGQYAETDQGNIFFGSPSNLVFEALAAPEPSAWVMMSLGLAVLGGAVRRSRAALA